MLKRSYNISLFGTDIFGVIFIIDYGPSHRVAKSIEIAIEEMVFLYTIHIIKKHG